MSPEEKDQLSQPKEGDGEESAKSFDDQFDAGWKKYEEERDLAIKTEGKETPKPESQKPEAKAPADQKPDDRKPIRILKVQGKEIPVYTEKELDDYAQMGIDYTKKRQADTEDRRKWEETFEKKSTELNTMGKKFNDIWDSLEKKNFKPEVETKGLHELTSDAPIEKVYEAYELDPEFARPHEKKLIGDVHAMRGMLTKMDEAVRESSKALHFFQVKEVVTQMGRIIEDEKKNSPFEDVFDDAGKSLTLQQFSQSLTSKAKAAVAAGQQLDLNALTRETVREISLQQSKAKDSVAISEDMSEEEFIKKYPKLAAKLGRTAGQQALDKHTEERSKVPPSLDKRSREVDLKKKPVSHDKVMSLADQLEAGFNDPEILQNLRG